MWFMKRNMLRYIPFCSSITIFFSTILGIATSFLSCDVNGFLYEEKLGNGGKVFWSVEMEKYNSQYLWFVGSDANYEVI